MSTGAIATFAILQNSLFHELDSGSFICFNTENLQLHTHEYYNIHTLIAKQYPWSRGPSLFSIQWCKLARLNLCSFLSLSWVISGCTPTVWMLLWQWQVCKESIASRVATIRYIDVSIYFLLYHDTAIYCSIHGEVYTMVHVVYDFIWEATTSPIIW